MTWEWSHTEEAYANARANFEALPRDERNIIAAEWQALDKTDKRTFRDSAYHRSLRRVKDWTDERLNDFCWFHISEQRRCTNGGYAAHCCPFGCSIHMVSFSPPGEPARERLADLIRRIM